MLSPYVLDEREGTLEIDYLVFNFTASERLSVFINGEERCKFFLLRYCIQTLLTRTPRGRSHP
jgi:hypothetical protein